VRDGAWKLVRKFPNDWELYNMEKDRTELNNLCDREKNRAERLIKEYQAWAGRIGVLDWPLPDVGNG
jgi:arylsulfatase